MTWQALSIRPYHGAATLAAGVAAQVGSNQLKKRDSEMWMMMCQALGPVDNARHVIGTMPIISGHEGVKCG